MCAYASYQTKLRSYSVGGCCLPLELSVMVMPTNSLSITGGETLSSLLRATSIQTFVNRSTGHIGSGTVRSRPLTPSTSSTGNLVCKPIRLDAAFAPLQLSPLADACFLNVGASKNSACSQPNTASLSLGLRLGGEDNFHVYL